MIEGKTKRGFAYAIAEENVDQEFLDALAEAEDGQPLKVSKALRLLLGEEQRGGVVEHQRERRAQGIRAAHGQRLRLHQHEGRLHALQVRREGLVEAAGEVLERQQVHAGPVPERRERMVSARPVRGKRAPSPALGAQAHIGALRGI